MASLSFGDIKNPGKGRVKIITDKVFKQGGKKNIFQTEVGDFYASGILVAGFDYPGNASAADKKKYAKEIKTKIDKASNARALGDFDLIGKVNNAGSKIYLPITKVIKTEEFGGGGGSGGGSDTTTLAESAACIATAWLIHKKKDLTMSDLSTKAGQTYIKKTLDGFVDLGPKDTKEGIQEVIDFLMSDPEWLSTSVRTAKKIKTVLKLNSKHHFHRDSAFMNNIYKEASKHIKKLNSIGIRIGGDKWNPGDIWIAEGSGNEGFSATKDLSDLNKAVLRKFNASNIMGVSLKKLPKAGNATLTVYNLPKQQRNFEFKEVKKPAGNLMDSKDIYIVTKAGKEIQIRTFDTGADIQCEIKGGAAAGGKAGFGVTAYAINKVEGISLDRYPQINTWTEPEKVKKIQNYYREIYNSSIQTKNIVDGAYAKKNKQGKSFEEWSEPAQFDYWSSKIQGMQIASIIKNSKQKNDIVTIIFAYAASLGLKDVFEASTYAKVY